MIGEGLIALLIVPVTMLVMSAVSRIAVRLVPESAFSLNPFEPIVGSSDRAQPLALLFLAIAVAPLAEEFAFRGMLYNALRQRLHPIVAACLQAAAFGIVHPFRPEDRVAIAAIGLVLGLIYEWRKTLLAPIALHALVNIVGVLALFSASAQIAKAPVLGVVPGSHDRGCLVVEVQPGTAAAEAGLAAGDVITAVAGQRVLSPQTLVGLIRTMGVGDTVTVDFLRGGEHHEVDVKLKARPKP